MGEVTGADDKTYNGWYTRKEATEGPPRLCPLYLKLSWSQRNSGRWYEKDDGWFIFLDENRRWRLCSRDDLYQYHCPVPADQGGDAPPAQGWVTCNDTLYTAPTLRVVH